MNSHFRKNFLIATAMLIAGFVAGYFIGAGAPCRGKSPGNGGHYILPYETAKRYVSNYGPRASFVVQNREGREIMVRNPRYVWFPAWRIQELLCQVDKEGGNGIRFYFATYDSSYQGLHDGFDERPPDTTFWGRNTLLFVSTKDSNGVSVDYFPGPEAGKPRKGFIVAPVYENNGEMCPPPPNCLSRGASLLDSSPYPFPKTKP